MNYCFHKAAESEHLEIIGFYESRQPGLGAAYLKEFESLMSRVVNCPSLYRVQRAPNIRVASLFRFPYRIIFRDVLDGVQVLAISHKKRRPDYWSGRL